MRWYTRYIVKGVVILVAAAGITSCATVVSDPSKTNPVPICEIHCPDGWMFPNHQGQQCRNNKTQFEDDVAIGRYTTRNADGTISIDQYIGRNGDHPVQNTAKGSCWSVIEGRISGRSAGDRGQYPGEDSHGQPTPPPK